MNPTTAPRHVVAPRACRSWCRALLIVVVTAFAAPSVVTLAVSADAVAFGQASESEAEHQLRSGRRAPVADVHLAAIRVTGIVTAAAHPEQSAAPVVAGWQVREHDRRGPPDLRGPPLRR